VPPLVGSASPTWSTTRATLDSFAMEDGTVVHVDDDTGERF
jgi:hypothetical protein